MKYKELEKAKMNLFYGEGKGNKRGLRTNNTGIPDFELETLARMLLPKIQEMFKDENVQKEFEEWKVERAKKK